MNLKTSPLRFWSIMFYDETNQYLEDLGLRFPDIAGIPGDDVVRFLNDYDSKEIRRILLRELGLHHRVSNSKLLKVIHERYVFEFRTIDTALRGMKRKITNGERRTYAMWAGLSDNQDEDTIRNDIIRRWKNTWFYKAVTALQDSGYHVDVMPITVFEFEHDPPSLQTHEKYAFDVSSEWMGDSIEANIQYERFRVRVTRTEPFSDKGDVLWFKWDIRYAPGDFEQGLMEAAGFELVSNRFDDEFWFERAVPEPEILPGEFRKLKQIQRQIECHFKPFHRSEAICERAWRYLKKSPERALKETEDAIQLNPSNLSAHVLRFCIIQNSCGSHRTDEMLKIANLPTRNFEICMEAAARCEEIECFDLGYLLADKAVRIIEDNYRGYCDAEQTLKHARKRRNALKKRADIKIERRSIEKMLMERAKRETGEETK